jgi:hypothetical protein
MRRQDAAVSIRSPPQRGELSSTRLERLPRLARRGWLRVWANLPLLVNGSVGQWPVERASGVAAGLGSPGFSTSGGDFGGMMPALEGPAGTGRCTTSSRPRPRSPRPTSTSTCSPSRAREIPVRGSHRLRYRQRYRPAFPRWRLHGSDDGLVHNHAWASGNGEGWGAMSISVMAGPGPATIKGSQPHQSRFATLKLT